MFERQSSVKEPSSAEAVQETTLQFELDTPLAHESILGGRAEEDGDSTSTIHQENNELKAKLQLLEESETDLKKSVEQKEEEMTKLQSEVSVLQSKLQKWEDSDDRSRAGGRGSPSGSTSQGAAKKSAGVKGRHNR